MPLGYAQSSRGNLCASLFSTPVRKTLFQTWRERSAFFSELDQTLSEIEKDDAELSYLENAKEFFQLTQKISATTTPRLLEQDLQFLKSRPKTLSLQKLIVFSNDINAAAAQLLVTVSNFWNLHPIGFKANLPSQTLQAVSQAVQATLSIVGWVFNPLSFKETKIDKVFRKQEVNPDRKLTPDEDKLLTRNNLTKDYHYRKSFIEKYPRWVIFRRWVTRVTAAALIVSNLMVINHDLHLARNMVSADSYISQVVPSQKTDQVDILVDIATFTHMAVQMDGKVYSYGQTNLNVEPANAYLAVGTNSKIAPRSLQVVRVNLPSDERLAFKRDLERSALKNYNNITFINDCATMIARALRRNGSLELPPVTDASPSQMIMYLSLLNTMGVQNSQGERLVSTEYQVDVDDPQQKVFHFLRNSYYNIIESNFFILNAPFLQIEKSYFNLKNEEKDLQWWLPEVKEQFRVWQQEQTHRVQDDPQVRFIEEQLRKASALRNDERSRIVLGVEKFAGLYFSQEIEKARLIEENSNTDLNDAFVAEFRENALKKKQDEIYRTIRSLNSP